MAQKDACFVIYLFAFSGPPIYSGWKFYISLYYQTECMVAGEMEKEKEGAEDTSKTGKDTGDEWLS